MRTTYEVDAKVDRLLDDGELVVFYTWRCPCCWHENSSEEFNPQLNKGRTSFSAWCKNCAIGEVERLLVTIDVRRR
jgi:transcription elongation factor Elf1